MSEFKLSSQNSIISSKNYSPSFKLIAWINDFEKDPSSINFYKEQDSKWRKLSLKYLSFNSIGKSSLSDEKI